MESQLSGCPLRVDERTLSTCPRLEKCPPFFYANARDVPRYARPHRFSGWKYLEDQDVAALWTSAGTGKKSNKKAA